jgi:predicted  nucleic acid-binding Zn-ribbon protein
MENSSTIGPNTILRCGGGKATGCGEVYRRDQGIKGCPYCGCRFTQIAASIKDSEMSRLVADGLIDSSEWEHREVPSGD